MSWNGNWYLSRGVIVSPNRVIVKKNIKSVFIGKNYKLVIVDKNDKKLVIVKMRDKIIAKNDKAVEV